MKKYEKKKIKKKKKEGIMKKKYVFEKWNKV
jgi:hypothetical protein